MISLNAMRSLTSWSILTMPGAVLKYPMLSLISRDWGLGPVSVITVTLVWVGDLGGRCAPLLSVFIILRSSVTNLPSVPRDLESDRVK